MIGVKVTRSGRTTRASPVPVFVPDGYELRRRRPRGRSRTDEMWRSFSARSVRPCPRRRATVVIGRRDTDIRVRARVFRKYTQTCTRRYGPSATFRFSPPVTPNRRVGFLRSVFTFVRFHEPFGRRPFRVSGRLSTSVVQSNKFNLGLFPRARQQEKTTGPYTTQTDCTFLPRTRVQRAYVEEHTE